MGASSSKSKLTTTQAEGSDIVQETSNILRLEALKARVHNAKINFQELKTPEGGTVYLFGADPLTWRTVRPYVEEMILETKPCCLGITHPSPAGLAVQGCRDILLEPHEMVRSYASIDKLSKKLTCMTAERATSVKEDAVRLLSACQLSHSNVLTEVIGTEVFLAAVASVEAHEMALDCLHFGLKTKTPVGIADVEFYPRQDILSSFNSSLGRPSLEHLRQTMHFATPKFDTSIRDFLTTLAMDTMPQAYSGDPTVRPSLRQAFGQYDPIEQTRYAAHDISACLVGSSGQAFDILKSRRTYQQALAHETVSGVQTEDENIDADVCEAAKTLQYIKFRPFSNIKAFPELMHTLENDEQNSFVVAQRIRSLANSKSHSPIVCVVPTPRFDQVCSVWDHLKSTDQWNQQQIHESLAEALVRWGDLELGGDGSASRLNAVLHASHQAAETDDIGLLFPTPASQTTRFRALVANNHAEGAMDEPNFFQQIEDAHNEASQKIMLTRVAGAASAAALIVSAGRRSPYAAVGGTLALAACASFAYVNLRMNLNNLVGGLQKLQQLDRPKPQE